MHRLRFYNGSVPGVTIAPAALREYVSAMRTGVLALLLLSCLSCGGEVADETQPPVNAPAPAPVNDPTPSSPTSTPPATPANPAPAGDATATRDGAPLYLTMCQAPLDTPSTLHIWGEITDPSFEVDEGIIALDVTPPTARGALTCGKDVRVVFAEGRGAEFDADPNACSVVLSTNRLGQIEGHVKAEYVDTYSGKRHAFAVDFAAGDCAK